jgi:hypothetical protein
MAVYNVPRGQLAAHDKVLVANVADDVVFVDEVGRVTVWTDGTAAVFVCTDGNEATVNGGDCYELEAGAAGSQSFPVGQRKVSLISAGTPKYSVQRAE